MATISGNYSNFNGISGMASGMDTESVVKKLMTASTERINKVQRQKQLLEWKQADYRSIVGSLTTFKNKYFSTTSGMSSAFYASKAAAPKNAADAEFASITVPNSVAATSITLSDIKIATQTTIKSADKIFGGGTERVDLGKSVADNSLLDENFSGDTISFKINGKDFSFGKDTSVNSIINAVNRSDAGVRVSYSSITDKFTMTSVNTGAASDITLEDGDGGFLTKAFGTLTEGVNYTKGTDASVIIDGELIEKSSNIFVIDGITFNLKADHADEIKMNITSDVDKAVANIKGFIDDYNSLLETLSKKVNEERFRDFQPLTDDQKKELSESDRKLWEEKSKSGLLKGDDNLNRILNSMRNAIYAPIKQLSDNSQNLPMTMASIGIQTESYLDVLKAGKDGSVPGKLVIDEQKLREALTNNPDEVVNLFTQKSDKMYLPTNTADVIKERYDESGIMYRLSDVLDDYARTSLGGGQLLKIAGYPGTSTVVENTISRALSEYDRKLDRLLDAFTREENRYFSQFTRMETYISQMNNQSQWLQSKMN